MERYPFLQRGKEKWLSFARCMQRHGRAQIALFDVYIYIYIFTDYKSSVDYTFVSSRCSFFLFFFYFHFFAYSYKINRCDVTSR